MSEDVLPDDYTVAEAKEAVRETDFTDEELYYIHEREKSGKNRTTLGEWLDGRYDYDPDAVEVDTDEPATPADAAPSREGPPRETDTPTLGDDDYDPATHHAWAPGEVPTPQDIPLVVVAPMRSGMIAGYNFAHTGDTRVVARNRRVDDAIVDGALVYQRPAPDGTNDGDRL